MDHYQQESGGKQSLLSDHSREQFVLTQQTSESLAQRVGRSCMVEEYSESTGEESSPSWASNSTGNTPSPGTVRLAFEFGQKCSFSTDYMAESVASNCTFTRSRRSSNSDEQKGQNKTKMSSSLSSDQLADLKSQESKSGTPNDWVYGVRAKIRKGSGDNFKLPGGASVATSLSKSTEKFSRLLRRTRSAGCSKDVPAHALFLREKLHFTTETKSTETTMTCKVEVEEEKKSHRKSLAQDMKQRLRFLRRRHTDSSIQSSIRPSPDEAGKWATSFQELMASKYGSALFRAFLSREFCEENIEFWLACEEFKKTKSNKLQSKARKIYNDFIAVQAPKEVNLDSTTRTAVMNKLSKPDHRSFDQAQGRIQGLMERDAYMRFLQSELYLELLRNADSI
ncbi:regulator of G-protein signaling 3-like [Limulus polyphemus]|uniref:Regulator of G-protein signaling 3-like n=1 Tax=Limulus polyphemus TaxID=6850 RepID=A0ABM1BFZ8_LIMPO|nr:regulator of G-protein signaling 3-like [Limulus polyphemus]